MGNKHAMSLRLKKTSYWGNTSYYFNSNNEQHNYWGVDKIALNVIKHYFQFALISKPKFYKDSNKVVISFYYFLNLPVSKRLNSYGQSKKIQLSLQKGLITNNKNLLPLEARGYSKLILKLSRFYGKPVELKPVRIHYPYLNSYILAQYIGLNIRAGKFNKIIQNLFKKIKLIKNNNPTSNNLKDLIRYSSEMLNPYYLTGLKIVISGRLSQRKAASRTRIVTKSIGTLKLGSFSSIDASKYTFTGKNGSITVKVWLSSNYINSLVKNKLTNTPLLHRSDYSKFRNSVTQGIRHYSTNRNNSIDNNGTFLPVITYYNVDKDKLQILKDSINKTGIYLWTHLESGKNMLVVQLIYLND